MKISYGINNLKKTELSDVNDLIKQLTKREVKIGWKNINAVMKNEILFVVRDGKKVIGLAVLTKTWKLTAYVGTIEDVVVDENYRGQGIGKKLISMIIEKAKKLKMDYIQLTSHPGRIEANLLYQKIGFEIRETNSYHFRFESIQI